MPSTRGSPVADQTASGPLSTILNTISPAFRDTTSTAAGDRYLSVRPTTAQPSTIGQSRKNRSSLKSFKVNDRSPSSFSAVPFLQSYNTNPSRGTPHAPG